SRPRSAAFVATSPAASMTDGLDVFVQLVIAAMTTAPCWAGRVPLGTGVTGASCCNGTFAGPAFFLSCRVGSAVEKDVGTHLSGTRSCGRLGPASDGSTVPRSSSSASEYVAACADEVRHRPCSLQYASTRRTCLSLRPVRRRYASVSSSTGKMPQVAPYS